MNDKLLYQATEYEQAHSRKRRWHKVVTAMAAVVVFCTTYALILPAITMSETVYCGYEDSHTEECWAETPVLVCGLCPEGHTHTESCYETQAALVCGLEESEEHSHSDACYETERVLICGSEEYAPHEHTEECWTVERELVCGKETHTHTLQCYSDPTADVQTRNTWERRFDDVELSGEWGKDVLAIAETQLGYAESARNYQVAEDGVTKKGYTVYGDWYGDPYGDWCAMFCSFCLHYAGVDAELFPQDASCSRWAELLADEKYDLYRPAEGYEPKPGDLIFFDHDEEPEADHVGIVAELTEAAENEPAQIRTIEGNNGKAVAYHTYDLDDASIRGYAALPENPDAPEEPEALPVESAESEYVSIDVRCEDDTVLLIARPGKNIDREKYLWQWQYSADGEDWADVDGATELTYSFFADSSEAGYYYRISGQRTEPEETVRPLMKLKALFAAAPEVAAAQADTPAESGGELPLRIVSAAVAPLSVAVSGTYYQRVTSLSDINTRDTYLIVSAQGSYAFRRSNSDNYLAVTLNPVKGNPNYYTISESISTQARWKFTSVNGAAVTMQTQGSTKYYLRLDNDTILATGSGTTNTLTYSAVNGTWTINSGSYYLRNDGGTFTRSTNGSYQRNMLILKQVNASLDIPEDVSGGSSGGESGAEKTQPAYSPDAATISGTKQGDIADISTVIPDAGEYITASYASDPSTSGIEDQFFSTISNGQSPTVNDGKVITDKSVIYGNDDYGAFSSYADGTFGVTLSALGQDYQLREMDQVKVPVDVVFVLDVSGSMGNAAGSVTRREAVVNAVNYAMKTIMEDNAENRAGVVLYSSGGSTLLQLDHYTAGRNDQYLNYNSDKIRTAYNLRGTRSGTISQTFGEVNGFTQSHGTYTQYGIALGAKLLQDNSDTTYTTTLRPGTDYEKTVTVIRQPVIILLSDGDPTHCTSNYTDVLNGPHYGDGVYPSTTNNKGIQGYYTILSANYYKRMVGIHYDVPATFYTIGMGINATGYADLSGASSTGDCYKRAVLNPTAANIADLLSNGAQTTRPNSKYTAANTWSISCQMLNQLLGSSYGSQYVTVGSTGSYSQIGTTNTNVPVLKNPYSGNYSYADGAYFGNLDTAALQDIFGGIIQSSLNVKSYGYMLYQGTSVEISDPIGEGMELKGTPVLRYDGRNYTLTKAFESNGTVTYVCNATAVTSDGSGVNGSQRSVDLRDIQITVTTTDGVQTVSMRIPETAVPSYTPESTADWYYEQLPVRLIYQVGLTAEAKAEVSELGPGETRTYYTNAWGNTSAAAIQHPHEDNPYYNNVTYEDGTSRTKQFRNNSVPKSENATNTASAVTVSAETVNRTTRLTENVTVALGNNGKLVFHSNMPELVSLSIQKVDMNGNPIVTDTAEFKLYSDESLQSLIDTYVTDETGTLTIEDLTPNVTYYLVETRAPDGFHRMAEAKAFSVDAHGTATGISPGDLYLAVGPNGELLVRNSSGYELPQTGGIGTTLYTFGGLALMAGAAVWGYTLKRRRERGAE